MKIRYLVIVILMGVFLSMAVACDMGVNTSDTTSESQTISPADDLPISALWLWFLGDQLTEKDEQDNFFRVLTEGNFNTAYIRAEADIIQYEDEDLAAFITRAHGFGIKIYGIIARELPRIPSGDGISIVPDPDPNIDKPLIEAYLQYNVRHPEAKIDGIIWDIEPIENNMLGMIDYMHVVKTYSYQDQTLQGQGMKLTLYSAAPKFLTVPRNDSTRMPEIAKMYQEFDLIAFSTYWDNIGFVIWEAGEGPQLCEILGVDFIVGFESDESTENSILDVHSSLFKAGKQRYLELVAQSEDYFNRWSHYKGNYLHHWMSAISWWWEIKEAEILQGSYHPGDTIPIMVNLFRGRQYSTNMVGIKISISHQDLNWEFSRVIALNRQVTVTVYCPIPSEAPSGKYNVEISTWDLDHNMDGGQRTSHLLDGATVAQLESLTMDEIEAANLIGARFPFIKLDSVQLTLDVLSTS